MTNLKSDGLEDLRRRWNLRDARQHSQELALKELMLILPESPRKKCLQALQQHDFNVDAAACELLVDAD